MKTVGIKEFKTNATQIVREVRERCEEYVVTVDGTPVAVVSPYTAVDAERQRRAKIDEDMAAIKELAAEISQAWISPLSAAEAVAEQRR